MVKIAYLRQIPDMVGIEQQFLQRTRVPQDFLRHVRQRAVALVHVLDLPIAALEDRDAFKHCRTLVRSTMLLFFLFSMGFFTSSRN